MKKPNRIDREDSNAPAAAQSEPSATAESSAYTQFALIILEQEYQRIAGMEFEQGVVEFDALADLIQHHPGFQAEVRAIRQNTASVEVLRTLQTRVRELK